MVNRPLCFRTRVIVLGDVTVGKSALLEMLVNTNFAKNYNMTTGIAMTSKLFQVPSTIGDTVEFLFLDCSGNRHLYQELLKKALISNSLICLVYDVTNKHSFETIGEWFDFGQDYVLKGFPGLLLANKADLVNRRFVSEANGRDLAQKLKLSYFEVSAKDNSTVKEAFNELSMQFYQKKKKP